MHYIFQYKDAFMKANPDYKWHNPEKLHPITKMITRPTNVRVLKEEPDIPMDTCIVPGKLAGKLTLLGRWVPVSRLGI